MITDRLRLALINAKSVLGSSEDIEDAEYHALNTLIGACEEMVKISNHAVIRAAELMYSRNENDVVVSNEVEKVDGGFRVTAYLWVAESDVSSEDHE